MRHRPLIVQHSAGSIGEGGPQTELQRVLSSHLAEHYEFVPMHQSARAGGLDLRLIRRWVRLLRSTKPDLVHIRGLQNEGFHAVLAARLAGCTKILVTVHGTVRDLQFGRRSLRRAMVRHVAEPATLALASHVATVCRSAARRKFVQRHSKKFIGVIPNGIDAHLRAGSRDACRAQLGIDTHDIVAITVARATWEKGFATLREALAGLPRTPGKLIFLVAGDGPDLAAITRSFDDVEHVDVRFLGRRLDVPDLLAAADLFVFPTLHENLSNALLEAMAHHLPSVASAVGGNIEVLTSGGGILVPPGDAGALAEGMSRLISDGRLRQELGRQAKENVVRNYSLNGMLDALDRGYRTATGRSIR